MKSDIPIGGCFCENGPRPIYDNGFDICTICGVVIEPVFDDSPEYEYDDMGNDISHTSSFTGSAIAFGSSVDCSLANKLQNMTLNNQEVKHNEMQKTINIICDAFKISHPNIIRDQAIGLVEKLEERNVRLHGKKRFASYAVAVFFSCKMNNASRELRSIASVCSMDIRDLNYAVNVFREKLSDLTMNMCSSEHEILVDSTLRKIDFDSETYRIIWKNMTKFVREHQEIFETGRKPRTVVAGLLMIMVFTHSPGFDIRKISKALDISHSSISTAAKEISKMCDISF